MVRETQGATSDSEVPAPWKMQGSGAHCFTAPYNKEPLLLYLWCERRKGQQANSEVPASWNMQGSGAHCFTAPFNKEPLLLYLWCKRRKGQRAILRWWRPGKCKGVVLAALQRLLTISHFCFICIVRETPGATSDSEVLASWKMQGSGACCFTAPFNNEPLFLYLWCERRQEQRAILEKRNE